jgi:hypothetical protein
MKISFDEDREVVELITLFSGDFFELDNEKYMVVNVYLTNEQATLKAAVKLSGNPTVVYLDKKTQVTELEQIKPLSFRYKRPSEESFDDDGR